LILSIDSENEVLRSCMLVGHAGREQRVANSFAYFNESATQCVASLHG